MEAVVIVAGLCMAFTLYAMPFGVTRLSTNEFFLMDRSAAVKQYNDTTVAYSTQVAVTVYFFYWGFRYGLSNIMFIASWFLGLLVFGLSAAPLAKFVSSVDFDGSLFSLISSKSRALRSTMGGLFIVSLIGLLFTEVYLTATFVNGVTLARRVPSVAPNFYFWVSFIFLAVAVLWYCSLGGMRKVVATDTWQISIAYVGMAVLTAALAPSINGYAGTSAMMFVEIGMSILFILMAALPSITSRFVQKNPRFRYTSTTVVTLIALITSAAICFSPVVALPRNIGTANLLPASTFSFPKGILTIFADPFGWAPVVGFTIINMVWQFSDYTAFHRLAILSLPEDLNSRETKIRESIFATMFNSPLTWGLGIFAGMAVSATNLVPSTSTDVFNDFVSQAAKYANAGNTSLQLCLVGLAAFLGSIMLSTVDTGFMSVALIVVRDIIKKPLSVAARLIVNVGVVAIMAAFALVIVDMKINILVFLNATYSWGLIFGGITIAYLLGKKVSRSWAYVSLGLGATIGAISTVNIGLPDLVALIFPSVAAIVISGGIILFAPSRPGTAPPSEPTPRHAEPPTQQAIS